MVRDILREAPFGQIVNRLSHGKLFPYEDQRPGYVVPERYLEKKQALSTASTLAGTEQRRASSELGDKHQAASSDSGGDPEKQVGNETEAAPQPSSKALEKSPYLVEFGENDPDNPKRVPRLCASPSAHTLQELVAIQATLRHVANHFVDHGVVHRFRHLRAQRARHHGGVRRR